MKNRKIFLSEITPEQLKELVGSSVKSQLNDFKKALGNLHSNDELLSREEACKFLKSIYRRCGIGHEKVKL